MGTSVINIRVVGNHGCQREKGDREKVEPTCGREECARGCVDAVAKEFVEKLRQTGSIVEATLTHWPDSSPIIVDDLRTGTRYGSFMGKAV
jgi:hypothetical protein